MQKSQLISVDQFCVFHNIEFSFVKSLGEFGLIETIIVEDATYIPESQVKELEKLMQFHYDLDINIEGLEAINHLLQQVRSMQEEIRSLKNKVRFYEISTDDN